MIEIVPNYYEKFRCIADKCKHNCCIGWEIDIDEDTMELYNSLDTPMGERIRRNIEGDEPHFILGKDDRCPFLNEKGLCDIICEHGDGAICDICYLHPRFKNFYSSFEETGLGLCCEEAARIILSEKEKFFVEKPDAMTEEEEIFFRIRNKVFSALQNRELTIMERFSALAEDIGIEFEFSLKNLCDFYLSLERLDDCWTEELLKLKEFSFDKKIFCDDRFKVFFEQLGCYFIFRHLRRESYEDGINFMLISCYLIGAMWANNENISIEKMADIARMYSAEIEYSDENTDMVSRYEREFGYERNL